MPREVVVLSVHREPAEAGQPVRGFCSHSQSLGQRELVAVQLFGVRVFPASSASVARVGGALQNQLTSERLGLPAAVVTLPGCLLNLLTSRKSRISARTGR
ncbi:hypothetical protein [Amycolatopsis sp. CA-230715]|uniref:hypothetical protein n=1 Tax=Amycolatopsis sp. CA-230715 TaxID=2745196 RepID=UPI001C015CE8|nr:hypothetical protein [Amycolatopsis sp. CA-230715]